MNNPSENVSGNIPACNPSGSIKTNERIALEKPGKDIIEPTLAYIPPEKNIENYVVSKAICKKLEIFPKTETIYYNAPRKYIETLQQYNYATKLWNEKLEQVQETNKENEKIISGIIDDQTDLWRTQIDFEELVVSNVYKRERCQRMLKDSHKDLEEKENEIQGFKKRIKKFEKARESLKTNIEKYNLYADFLQQFINLEPKFKNIDNIVKRYDELSATRKSIAKEQVEIISAIDDFRHEKACYMEEKKSQLMGFENEVIRLEEKYNHARHISSYWERMQYHARRGYLNRMLAIERVVKCGYNMYEDICCRTGSQMKITIYEKMRLFQYIKNVLEFYEKVLEIAIDLHERQLSSGYVETEDGEADNDYLVTYLLDNEKDTEKSNSEIVGDITLKREYLLEM